MVRVHVELLIKINMKEIEKYTVKEAVATLERKIKFLENKMKQKPLNLL